jgi:alpha-methylacyl-CoA racemase
MPTLSASLPLNDIHVVELMGIGPVPYAGQLLADMGAQVIRIHKEGAYNFPVENRGKTALCLDLRSPEGSTQALKHIAAADVLIEGARPGVTEKLGLGPKDCHALNPKLIYGRMTGWGQSGPWALKAGHDINYIGLTGALYAMGEDGRPPSPPLNLVGDYGGGASFLVMGILAAMLHARSGAENQVVDAAIIDGTASMMGIVNSLAHVNMWTPERAANLLDGSRPYYRCYETADQGFMAVGCLEPQFYAEFLERLGLKIEGFGGQNEPALWPQQIQILEELFKGQTRQHWEGVFENSDACTTPVLSYEEAPEHPQNQARNTYIQDGTLTQPAPAPRFSRS